MSGSEHPINIAIVKCEILCSVCILCLNQVARGWNRHTVMTWCAFIRNDWVVGTLGKYMFSVFRYPIHYCWCQSTLFNFEFQNYARTTSSLEWPTHIGQWVHLSEGHIHCADNIPAQQLHPECESTVHQQLLQVDMSSFNNRQMGLDNWPLASWRFTTAAHPIRCQLYESFDESWMAVHHGDILTTMYVYVVKNRLIYIYI